jgi:serine/threonine protein kinase
MNQPNSSLAATSSVDVVLDRFLERLDQLQDGAGIAALVEEFSALHPARVAQFRRLAEGWRQLRDLRDPEHLGPYRVRGVIAVGGMGKIYEAEEDDLKRVVAVKTIKPGPNIDEQLLARFDRERKALARLHHTHVVPIFATGQQDGLLYFAMPRLRGASLRSLIKTAPGKASNGTGYLPFSSFEELVQEASKAEACDHITQLMGCPPTYQRPIRDHQAPTQKRRAGIPEYREKAVRLMIEVAEAVHHAHLASVIHRDLKPSNILVEHSSVGNSCHSWVLDFGLALFKTDPAEFAAPDPAVVPMSVAEPLTQGLLGTPIYMAPEQIEPSPDRPIDARTDVYALGATLYELLTFRPAVDVDRSIIYPGERLDRIRHHILHQSPKLPRRLVRGFPYELEAVCLKALEKRPEDRYASAQELASDLRHWLDGKPTKAGKSGPFTRLAMLVRRRRATTVAVAMLAFSLIGASAGFAYVSRVRENHAVVEAKANKAEAAHSNAQLRLAEAREQALQRETDLVSLERLRNRPHMNRWFEQVWSKARALQGPELNPQLQGHAAASLEGIDAKFAKTITRAFRHLAFDPKANRLLMHGDVTDPSSRPKPLTVLWDGASDSVVLEKNLGQGVVAFRDDGTPLQVSWDREDHATATLFDVNTSRPLRHFHSPREGLPAITALTLSRAGKHLAAVARPGRKRSEGTPIADSEPTSLIVWDTSSGDPVRTLDHKATVDLVLSPDGRVLAAWDKSGEVSVWLVAEGQVFTRFHVSRSPVNTVAFGRDPAWHESPANDLPPWLLAVGDSGGLITVWDLFANRPRSICRGSSIETHALDFSPDGTFLGSVGRGVRVWDVATGNRLLQISREGYQMQYAIAFASDGQSVSISNGPEFLNKPTVDIVEIEHGRGIRTLYGLQGRVEEIVVSPNGRSIAAISNDWQVGIWDRKSGRLCAVLEVPVGHFVDNTGMAFDADGQRFAWSSGHEARLWDLEKHRLLGQWKLADGLCDALAFDASGRLVLVRTETKSGKNPPYDPTDPSDDPRVIRLYNLLGSSPTRALNEITEFDRHVWYIAMAADAAYFVVEGLGTVKGRKQLHLRAYQGSDGKLVHAVSTDRPPHFDGSHMIGDPQGRVFGLPSLTDRHHALLELPSRKMRIMAEPELCCLGPGGSRWAVFQHLSPDQPVLAVYNDDQLDKPLVRILLERLPTRFRFTPDGQSVIWCNSDGSVSVADLPAMNRRLTEVGLGW